MEDVKPTEAELKDAVLRFASKFSVETTPKEGTRLANYGDFLDRGRRVFIAHIAGTPYTELIALAARLKREGFEPVMHVTARDMPSKDILNEVISRYVGEAGAKEILLIAGDMPSPTGDYADTISILRTGLLEKNGIKRIAMAGHPEGSKTIGDQRLREALKAKNDYARETGTELALVTQFGFEPQPFIDWEKRIREEGLNSLKIQIGLAGLASFPTLMRFALECGAGPSIRALKTRAGSFAKLATVAHPDNVIAGVARYCASTPNALIEGPHFFPFGGLKKTAEWMRAVLEKRFELNADASGFTVR